MYSKQNIECMQAMFGKNFIYYLEEFLKSIFVSNNNKTNSYWFYSEYV